MSSETCTAQYLGWSFFVGLQDSPFLLNMSSVACIWLQEFSEKHQSKTSVTNERL